MPRIARLIIPGVVHHIIWRFVDRDWFFTGLEDRAHYLRLLGRALEDTDWKCFAWGLMSNHIHLGMLAGQVPLETWSKRVSSPFARWMNEVHGRLGPVIADRPKSHAYRRDQEARLIAYIHNNPVRAGVVGCAIESTWTSHTYYATDASPPPWLDVELASQRTGIALGDEFARFVDGNPAKPGELDTAAVRKAARARGALEVATPLAGAIVPLVRRPAGHVRVPPTFCVELAADVLGLPVTMVCSQRRSSEVVAARYVAIQCAARLGLSGSLIAAVLGVSPSCVSRLVRRSPPSELAAAALTTALARVELELFTP